MTGIDRREALQWTGSALVAGVASHATPARAAHPKKVIVAGAGIAGLSCAYELVKKGHDVTVLEAAGRSGGHILTLRDGFADGLYADAGAEHFYKPGYEIFLRYVDEFKLPMVPYPRRESIVRLIKGKPYTEQMLADAKVLGGFGFNAQESKYLANHSWAELRVLYCEPYLDSFSNEYDPLGAKLNHLDHMTVTDLMKKGGASAAAISFAGGDTSALYAVWQAAVRKLRGLAQYSRKLFRIPGGNQLLTDTLAAKLGERLRLGAPVTGIEHTKDHVTVRYEERGETRSMTADYLVSAMGLTLLARIPVTPAWPAAKDYAIRNTEYITESRVIFQSRTPFWKRDGLGTTLEFSGQGLAVWRMAEEIKSSRGILIGNAPPHTTAAQALEIFRKFYPGKSEDIEQATVVDWAGDRWAMGCLSKPTMPGMLPKIWPHILEPVGRIHFTGTYADNLTFGMESALRSAQRAVAAIHG